MKLLMIIVDADHSADLETLLEQQGIPGYTEFPSVLGKGATARKLGTRAFPGSSTMYLAIVPREDAARLAGEWRRLRDRRGREEGLKVYELDATELI